MSRENTPARVAFDAWCEAPQYLRERARRRQQWESFLAGWIASQAPPRNTVIGTAGEDLEAGDLVHRDASGRWHRTT